MASTSPTSLKAARDSGTKQLGFMVALASWGMLFSTFILSFMLYRSRAPVWPPMGTEAIPPTLPTIATALLIASSFFIHAAFRQLLHSEQRDFRRFWGIGTMLGLMFLVLQISTWNHMVKMGMGFRSNFFASIYYTMTGLHAVHVLGGLAALAWIWYRADRFTAQKSLAPQLSAWFWHFMDGIWVIMFVIMVLT